MIGSIIESSRISSMVGAVITSTLHSMYTPPKVVKVVLKTKSKSKYLFWCFRKTQQLGLSFAADDGGVKGFFHKLLSLLRLNTVDNSVVTVRRKGKRALGRTQQCFSNRQLSPFCRILVILNWGFRVVCVAKLVQIRKRMV